MDEDGKGEDGQLVIDVVFQVVDGTVRYFVVDDVDEVDDEDDELLKYEIAVEDDGRRGGGRVVLGSRRGEERGGKGCCRVGRGVVGVGFTFASTTP